MDDSETGQIIGEDVYRQAVKSMEKNIDHELVAKWIVNFLTH